MTWLASKCPSLYLKHCDHSLVTTMGSGCWKLSWPALLAWRLTTALLGLSLAIPPSHRWGLLCIHSLTASSTGKTTHLSRSWKRQIRGIWWSREGNSPGQQDQPPHLLPPPPVPYSPSSHSPLKEGSLSRWREHKTLGNKSSGTREKGSPWTLLMPGTRCSWGAEGVCLNLRLLPPSLADEIQFQAAAFRGFT